MRNKNFKGNEEPLRDKELLWTLGFLNLLMIIAIGAHVL